MEEACLEGAATVFRKLYGNWKGCFCESWSFDVMQ